MDNWITDLCKKLLAFSKDILLLDVKKIAAPSAVIPAVPAPPVPPVIQDVPAPPVPLVIQDVPAPPAPSYLWDTRENARHSVRLICDEEGLAPEEKNLICQVISCESGFNAKEIHPNKDEKGNIFSTDYGIVQVNDFYHIGASKDFPSVQYVLANPSYCVRWMIKMYKSGKLNMWVCYKTAMYKNFPA